MSELAINGTTDRPTSHSPQDVPDDDALPQSHSYTTLDCLPVGEMRIVREIHPPADAPEWMQLLEEIGFIAGENVMLMARGMPGGDPLVVRIGLSTFALRRAEAACIRVTSD